MGVPERMVQVLPGANLVYLVRHPFERLVSHYIHMVNAGVEQRGINEALQDIEDNGYVAYSRYAWQLSRFLGCFPRNRIYLMTSEELRQSPASALRKLYEFIGVSADSLPKTRVLVHTRKEKRQWNRLGQFIRRTPWLDRRYRYYMGKLPPWLSNTLELATGRPVAEPEIDPSIRSRLESVFRDDIAALRMYRGAEVIDWKLGTDNVADSGHV